MCAGLSKPIAGIGPYLPGGDAQYVGAMHRHGLDTVFLAAPTSNERRLRLVAEYSTGFVYLVSRMGVTGERASLSNQVGPLIAEMFGQTEVVAQRGYTVLCATAPSEPFSAGPQLSSPGKAVRE